MSVGVCLSKSILYAPSIKFGNFIFVSHKLRNTQSKWFAVRLLYYFSSTERFLFSQSKYSTCTHARTLAATWNAEATLQSQEISKEKKCLSVDRQAKDDDGEKLKFTWTNRKQKRIYSYPKKNDQKQSKSVFEIFWSNETSKLVVELVRLIFVLRRLTILHKQIQIFGFILSRNSFLNFCLVSVFRFVFLFSKMFCTALDMSIAPLEEFLMFVKQQQTEKCLYLFCVVLSSMRFYCLFIYFRSVCNVFE